MSMKKTDLEKNMAKKLGRQLKASAIPQRFGAGSALATGKKEKTVSTPSKPVSVSIRLPAELAALLRERAVGQDGGVSTVVTQALEQWFSDPSSSVDDAGASAV
jgi:hypothetical protein